MELTTTDEFLVSQTSELITDKTSLLLDFMVGNMTSSPQPSSGRQQDYTSPESSTSRENLNNTLPYNNGTDSYFPTTTSGEGVHVSTHGSFTPTIEDTMCSEAESLAQGCRNDGVCVTRMEGEERRAMCECKADFIGEKCDSKFNFLWFANIPDWFLGLVISVAIIIVIVIIICCCRRHCTAKSRRDSFALSPTTAQIPGIRPGHSAAEVYVTYSHRDA